MTKVSNPRICIFGPGVVGYATGKALAEKKFKVGFIGRSQDKVKKLRDEGYWAYTFETFPNHSFDFDISFLTIATPTIKGKIQLQGIKQVAKFIGGRLTMTNKYHVIVVKSTVVPGTTEEIVIPLLEKYSGKKVGKDFGVCMNPEYLREKTAVEDSRKPWMVLIGQYDKKSGDMLAKVWKKFKCPVYRCSIKEAEMQKYVHNLYNAVKIAFFNEMRVIAGSMKADADTIFKYTALSCEGIWNISYGLKNFGPYSGSCLPKDTQAFHEFSRKKHFHDDVLKATIKANTRLLTEKGKKEKEVLGTSL